MGFSGEQLEQYRQIAANIRKVLSTREFLSNEEMYMGIIELEELWKKTLMSTNHGMKVYEKFIYHILHEKKNILDARPYFRVRQKEFLKKINPFIRNNKPQALIKHKVNYTFISWANEQYTGPHKKHLVNYTAKISKLRSDFITKNFPLILNRIKILYYTYSLADEITDVVNLASQAALNAIDKYVPNIDKTTGEEIYSSVLLSAIIARINAIVLNNFSNQHIYYYPKDKKKLVEINKLKREGKDNQEISKILSINESEIERLFNGFFAVSLENTKEMAPRLSEQSSGPENMMEQKDLSEKLLGAISKLSILEKKVLMLKGYTTNIMGLLDSDKQED